MANSGCGVLVVEDDRFIRESIVAALEAWGFRVMTAEDGGEALALVAASPPNVVLLDLRMPVVDGWTFARAVRERGDPVKLLVMTAGDAGASSEAIDVAGWLDKPFSVQTLIAEVRRLCAD